MEKNAERWARRRKVVVEENFYRLRQIKTRNALADRAEQIGTDGTDAARDNVGRVSAIAICAINRGDIADGYVGNVCDIEHHYIHGNDADDGGEMAAHSYAAAIAKRTMNAVAIARREHRNVRVTLGHPGCIVADTFTRWNGADVDDASAKTHHRAKRELGFDFFAPFDGVDAGMIAVENGAGTHHVCPSFRARSDRGTVGEVQNAGVDAVGAQAIDGGVEAIQLFLRLAADGRVGKNFGRREVGEDTGEFKMFALGELTREAVGVGRLDAQAIHAGVDFQVNTRCVSCQALQRRLQK